MTTRIALYLSLMFICVSCFTKGQMDAMKPVYQKPMPLLPVYQEVTPLTPEQLKEHWKDQFERENQKTMWKDGWILLRLGIFIFVAGFFMSGIIAQYGGELLANMVSPTGITLACTGGVFMKLAETWKVVSLGLLVILGYGIFSYLWRGKGFKFKKANGQSPEPGEDKKVQPQQEGSHNVSKE